MTKTFAGLGPETIGDGSGPVSLNDLLADSSKQKKKTIISDHILNLILSMINFIDFEKLPVA